MAKGESNGEAVIWLGLLANFVLTVFKFVAGILGHSQAMLADAAESLSDMVAGIIVVISLRISGRPVDEGHPYGHGKAESLATAIVGFVIGLAGLGILYTTSMSVLAGGRSVPGAIALWGAFVTIAAKEIMYRWFSFEATILHSTVLRASAQDYRKDAITSLATLAGIAGARLGFRFLDPLAAAITSFFIIKIGFEVVRVAAEELMDAMPSSPTLAEITEAALRCPGVEHVYGVRARRVGRYVLIDLRIEVDPTLSVEAGHQIAKRVKNELTASADVVKEVLVHVNPHYT